MLKHHVATRDCIFGTALTASFSTVGGSTPNLKYTDVLDKILYAGGMKNRKTQGSMDRVLQACTSYDLTVSITKRKVYSAITF